MSADAFHTADRWLERASAALDPGLPMHDYVREQLTEIRGRIARLTPPPTVAAAGAPGADVVRGAIDEAVAEIRRIPARLTPGQAVVLSKLLVLQTLLCTRSSR